jgi:peptidoglycan hydrolase FlgJ
MTTHIHFIGAQQPDQTSDLDKVAPAASTATDSAPAPDKAYVAKATQAAVEFESFFISHMLHQMRESTRTLAPEDSPTRDRVNQDMTDMVDNMLAGKLAGQRAFGVADAILKQLVPAPLNKAG